MIDGINAFIILFDGPWIKTNLIKIFRVTLCYYLENDFMFADVCFFEGVAGDHGRSYRIATSDDVVFVATEEGLFVEDELIKQSILVDCHFAL